MKYKAVCSIYVETPVGSRGARDLTASELNENLERLDRKVRRALKQEKHGERGLANCIWKDDGLASVESIFVSVGLIDGEVRFIYDIETKTEMTQDEEALLQDFLEGQNSDGFGENLEQEGTTIFIGGKKKTGYICIGYPVRLIREVA